MTSFYYLLAIGFALGFVWGCWRGKNMASGLRCYFYCAVCMLFFGGISYGLLHFSYLAYLDGVLLWPVIIPGLIFGALVLESVIVAVHEYVNTPTHIVYKNKL